MSKGNLRLLLINEVVSSGKAWAKEIIEQYSAGAGDAEVAASLQITLRDYYRQLSDNAAFSQLVEYGRTLSQAFWESQFRKNLNNKGFNSPLLAFYMKNKYGWADKTETVNANENTNMDLDALRQQVTKEVGKFIKAATPELTDAQRVVKLISVETDD